MPVIRAVGSNGSTNTSDDKSVISGKGIDGEFNAEYLDKLYSDIVNNVDGSNTSMTDAASSIFSGTGNTNSRIGSAAAKAENAIAAGTSNIGGYDDGRAWSMVSEAGGKGSVNDQVNKQGIIDAYLAELDDLSGNLYNLDTSVIDANAATAIADSYFSDIVPDGDYTEDERNFILKALYDNAVTSQQAADYFDLTTDQIDAARQAVIDDLPRTGIFPVTAQDSSVTDGTDVSTLGLPDADGDYTQADFDSIVGMINSGAINVGQVADFYDFTEKEVQDSIDEANRTHHNSSVVDSGTDGSDTDGTDISTLGLPDADGDYTQDDYEQIVDLFNKDLITAGQIADFYDFSEKEVQDAIDEANSRSNASSTDASSTDGSDVDGSTIDGSTIDGSDIDGSTIDGSTIDGSDLDGSDLDGSDLDGSDLDGSDLDGSDLDGSDLDGSDLDGSDVDGSTIDGSTIDGSTIDGSTIDGSTIDGSTIDGSTIDGTSTFGGTMSAFSNLFSNTSTTTESGDPDWKKRALDLWGDETGVNDDLLERLNAGFTDYTGDRFSDRNADQLDADRRIRGNIDDIPGKAIFDKSVAAANATTTTRVDPVTGRTVSQQAFGGTGDTNLYDGARRSIQDLVAGQFAGTNLDPYMNPYTDRVINRGLSDLDKATQERLNEADAQATRGGAYGGDRASLERGVIGGESLRTAEKMISDLRYRGYEQAADMLTKDMDREMDASGANQLADASVTRDSMNIAADLERTNQDSAQRSKEIDNQNQFKQAQALLDSFGQGTDAYRSYLGDYVGMGANIDASDQRDNDFDYKQFMDSYGYDEDMINNMIQLFGQAPGDRTTEESTEMGAMGQLQNVIEMYPGAAAAGMSFVDWIKTWGDDDKWIG